MFRKIALALVAVVAVIAAFVLIFGAAFPYVYGESGASTYARAHRPEAIAAILAAALLCWIAWYCIRHSLSGKTWLGILGLVVAALIIQGLVEYYRAPEGIQSAGGNWYVAVFHEPGGIDSVYYNLYYKRAAHYELIDDLVGEYTFVPPDCLTFRGLKAVAQPTYAMCGYRSPAGTYDTSIVAHQLLDRARTQPGYRDDWKSVVQQQDFSRTGKVAPK